MRRIFAGFEFEAVYVTYTIATLHGGVKPVEEVLISPAGTGIPRQ